MKGMTVEAFSGSVWEALERSPVESANIKLRSDLMIAIEQVVLGWQVTQAEAAQRLQITQPRLNDLLRGRIGKFSLDALVTLSARAGLSPRIDLSVQSSPDENQAHILRGRH
jgi:predicted XRE-type DNA-binding protein